MEWRGGRYVVDDADGGGITAVVSGTDGDGNAFRQVTLAPHDCHVATSSQILACRIRDRCVSLHAQNLIRK